MIIDTDHAAAIVGNYTEYSFQCKLYGMADYVDPVLIVKIVITAGCNDENEV
jgi:hypothetical protein